MKPDYSNNHSGNSSIIIYLPPNVNIRTREARAPTMFSTKFVFFRDYMAILS
jgi:hypothetical protein